ncbi:MAG: lysophospholipid acyltransferase family protein [Pseudomonadota bacterium]
MPKSARVARDISYSHSAQTRAGRGLIRSIENLTGRIKLIRMAEGYEEEVSAGRDFWDVITERYALGLELRGGSLDNVPKTGPVIVISNHPYGILDGLMMGYILSKTRGDFRILANSVFRKAEDLNRIILPISFDETKEAMRTNLETRKEALAYLANGGCVGVFPGGTVSTALKPFGRPMDPGWRRFTAKLISRSGAQVVPVFFDGHNSRAFQLASHVHSTLRLALLIKEFKQHVGGRVPVVIGEPLPPEGLAQFAQDPKGMMDYLRDQTYRLSPEPIADLGYGFEFEDGH